MSFLPSPHDDSPASISKSMVLQAKKQVPHEHYHHHQPQPQLQQRCTAVNWGSIYMYSPPTTWTQDDHEDEQELRSLKWYNATDLESFQQEKRRVIRAMKYVKGDLEALKNTKYESRGFECYQSVEYNQRVRTQRKAVIESVLQVQNQVRVLVTQQEQQEIRVHPVEHTTHNNFNAEFQYSGDEFVEERQHHHQQRYDDFDDTDELIAGASRGESSWAREMAHRMGLQDQHLVYLGWQEVVANAKAQYQDRIRRQEGKDDDHSAQSSSADPAPSPAA